MAGQDTLDRRPLVCVIAGRATNVAKAVALRFAEEGGRLELVGNKQDRDELEKMGRQCSNIGCPACDIHTSDLASPGDVDKQLTSTVSRHGNLDVVVVVADAFPDSHEVQVETPRNQEQNPAVRMAKYAEELFGSLPRLGEPKCAYMIFIVDGSNRKEASASHGLLLYAQSRYQVLGQKGVRLLCIDTAGSSGYAGVEEAALLPFKQDDLPMRVYLREFGPSVVSKAAAAAGRVAHEVMDKTSQSVMAVTKALHGELTLSKDVEVADQGQDPGPRSGATKRAPDGVKALYVKSGPMYGGIIEATGERASGGLLTRIAGPGEIHRARVNKPGAVMTPADPGNLEPLEPDVSMYTDEPARDPRMYVQCMMPYNGETPHSVLAESWITPATLFYVRNHLPVPDRVDPSRHKIVVHGDGVPGIQQLELTLDDLKAGFSKQELTATLECAGNRRNEMCVVHLVEGRAPWGHGAIGNAVWGGVWLRDVLAAAGLNVEALLKDESASPASHIWFKGMDWHRKSKENFEVSIPLQKAIDPRGDVMVAWEQNGEELQMDHGFPVRMIVPGMVGTRSVKWLREIVIADRESGSSWQQKDYKMLPPKYKSHFKAKPGLEVMPPIENMPITSAILVPEAGSVIPRNTPAIMVRGYAWGGGGLPIIRVDVSADEGKTWEMADVMERHDATFGRSWTWVLWQIPLELPAQHAQHGGKLRLCCKAWNRNYDSQPHTVEEIWNFRGLNCNSWHFVDLKVA